MFEVIRHNIVGLEHFTVSRDDYMSLTDVIDVIHLDEDETHGLFHRMLQAVSYMHNELRMAHLNLSPATILADRDGQLILSGLTYAVPVAPDFLDNCQRQWERLGVDACVELLHQGYTPEQLAHMFAAHHREFQEHYDKCKNMHEAVVNAINAPEGYEYWDTLAAVPRYTLCSLPDYSDLRPLRAPPPQPRPINNQTIFFDSARAIPPRPQLARCGNAAFTGQQALVEHHTTCPFAEDVYSLGMTFLVCLTGTTPFTATGDAVGAWAVGGIDGLLDHLDVDCLTSEVTLLLEAMLHPDPRRRPTVVQCLDRLAQIKIFWEEPEGEQTWPEEDEEEYYEDEEQAPYPPLPVEDELPEGLPMPTSTSLSGLPGLAGLPGLSYVYDDDEEFVVPGHEPDEGDEDSEVPMPYEDEDMSD
jgi:serine/threonine protein kinase